MMKKLYTTLAIIAVCQFCYAQTNTFPLHGNIGIGTIVPTQGMLEIAAPDESTNSAIAIRQSNSNGYGFDFALDQTIDGVGYWYAVYGYNKTALMQFDRNTKYVSFPGGNVGIGTTTPDSKLAVNGTIHAKEVKVDSNNWPDYVFKPDYDLLSLNQVKTYIDENHHLPEMPSEKEVNRNGINLGEMNKLLVKKVEELTLYLIEKDKEVNNLKGKMSQQLEVNKSNKLQLRSLQEQINEFKHQLNTILKN